MESVTEVPEEASGLRKPRFWIRVFLLLDRLPAKANEPCLRIDTHTHTHTHTQKQKHNIRQFHSVNLADITVSNHLSDQSRLHLLFV